MNSRQVLFQIDDPELRVVLTQRSTVALEPHNLEFATLEEVAEYVTIHPREFSSVVYDALLERLEAMGGGGLM
jgi:hypothetical protein